jgi:hypothetical protein
MAHRKARGHYDNYDMCGIAGVILLSSQGNCMALGNLVEGCFPSLHLHRQEGVGIVKYTHA